MVVTQIASACAEGARRRYERCLHTSSNSNLICAREAECAADVSGVRDSARHKQATRCSRIVASVKRVECRQRTELLRRGSEQSCCAGFKFCRMATEEPLAEAAKGPHLGVDAHV
eukprot:6208048-Pleurochrysis_carterae.AAC.4